MDKELNIKGLNMRCFRFISVLLMLFSVSTNSFATLTGKGTQSEPYIIDEPSDFPDLTTTISKNKGKYLYVRQEADVDMSELSNKANTGTTRPPLPLTANDFLRSLQFNSTSTFIGEYDGNGYTVSNWSITKNKMQNPVTSNYYYISMFGKVGSTSANKSIIKNLNIEGFDIETQTTKNGVNSSGFSFIASHIVNAEITNCHVKNSKIHGNGHFAFGAITANNDNSTITDCSVRDCEYTTSGAQSVGALCGVNSGTIKNCFAYDVTLNANVYVGGLVGEQNSGRIENCGFNGQICASDVMDLANCGGICGKVSKGTIINCFSVFNNGGKTWKSAKVFGGLVGNVEQAAEITVKNCYAFPNVALRAGHENVDYFVGRDMYKESDKRNYESCYCYENGYGAGYVPNITNGVDFSGDYKEKHKLLVASNDFMRSGCFAEILSDYHIVNIDPKTNPWREDVAFQNDTLPVLRFIVDERYDVDPFCHPGIYTFPHTNMGKVSKLNGQLKYITNDQTTEGWLYGFEVKVGEGKWEKVSDWTATLNENKINFFFDYEHGTSKTIIYRAYTYNPNDPSHVAYGKIDTVCVGSSTGPEIVDGCDSVKYENKWYYPKDNGTYKNAAGEEFIIKLGESRKTYLPKIEGDCGKNTVTYMGMVFDHSTVFETSFENETGCKTTNYQEIKLYPTENKDSLKVFTLGEMSYTYKPKGGIDPVTVSVGSEYVIEPKRLVVDEIPYKNNSCDSLTITVNYQIPIKITKTEDKSWSCKPVVYNGVTYTKETTLLDTIKTPRVDVIGNMLYEIRSHHIKVAVPDTIETSETHCGVIKYECPTGICESTEPFFDTVPALTTIGASQCPTKVTITHHLIGEKMRREENIVSCGPYTYTYRGRKEVWTESDTYVRTRSGMNPGACDNDTIVTYHVTIGESTSYKDTTIHGCGRKAFKTLSGETVLFEKSQDYEDVIKTPNGCNSKRIVHVYIHNVKDISSVIPQTGCEPFTFTKLNGEELVFNAGTHIVKDTIKSTDDCGCDSIVRTTTIMVDKPTTLKEIVLNGCDSIEVEGKVYKSDASFTVEKTDPNILKTCRTQFQPYKVKINSSIVEEVHVDTCGIFSIGDRTLKTSGKIEINKESNTGCDNKVIYDIRIIEPTIIDSVVYACDSYVHKYLDGHQDMIVDDGVVLVDKLKSKVCDCDSIIRKVTVNISHDTYEKMPAVTNCGPYTYVKKSNGKKILIKESQIVRDTTVTKYGCHIYFETEVNIIPVVTTIKQLDACKEYHSEIPVWNYNNNKVDVIVETPEVQTAELIFLEKNQQHPVCMDTTKLFLTVHGVGKIAADPVVECDSFIYKDYDGSLINIYSDTVIVDTLKSKVCDCDSVILKTNIKINKSIPESLRDTNRLRQCDSVIYKNSKGVEMTFTDNIQFLDTFQIKSTGCDSVVVVDINVPKSTGSVTILSACGDTTLIDSVNNNFPRFFDKSQIWRQVLNKNIDGCDNYKEWHVNIIPTPRDTIFERGCGELTFRGDTYTSENEKASSFGVVLNGATKCDTIHNYILTVYPKYTLDTTIVSCDSVIVNGKVYKNSIYFRDSMISRNDCDSVINYNIVVNHAYDEHDYVFGCNEVKFMDEDYNGGKPVYVHHDSTIYVGKMSDKGCPYLFIQQIEVGHPSYSVTEYVECYNSKTGYASFRDLKLKSDTVIYDTIKSKENKCGAVIANKVRLTMPVYETVSIFECLDSTIGYVSFRDLKLTSDTVIYDTLTSINNCDSIVANKINFINPAQDSVVVDSTFGCNQVKFTDANYNYGLTVNFNKDTIITFVKSTGDGCSFQLTKKIKVGHSDYAENEVYERYDTKLGYASYRELRLAADTVIYETIPSAENECGTVVKNKVKLMMPVYDTITTFECVDPLIGYVNFRHLRLKADTVIYDTVPTLNNYDSIAIHRVNLIFPVDGSTTVYVDTAYGCNEMNFIDTDFNGGLPLHINHDTTIIINKKTSGSGCDFQLTQHISIGKPDSSEADVFECFDSENGFATYRDLRLTADTVIYELIASDTNRCGTIMKNNVNVIMPVHDTIYIDSCLYITYEGVTYRDSAHIIRPSKSLETGCDSFTHVMLNVNKCFPYPVLVNKYNWILVCNDVIMNEDQFKKKSNVKYNWYKNDRLVSSTNESYYTEDKELKGCYQLGVVVDGGDEYYSDMICIDEKHSYSVSPRPNPVDKLKPVTIVCDFPEDDMDETVVEVFSMTADKVYMTTTSSKEVVIPGMTVSGYYLVRLTTASGKVLTTKYMVK